jgi:integrase/recombinase XerD
MLTIYRRHLKNCDHRAEGRKYRRCRCPIWIDGFIGSEEIRCSLNTRDWEKGHRQQVEWEAAGKSPLPAEPEEAMTLARAIEQFLDDARARNLCASSLSHYGRLLRLLCEFTSERKITGFADLDVQTLVQFRAQWHYGNLTALKQLERLRSFFRFARDNGWVADNLAAKIKNPRIVQAPTMPYTQEQVIGALKAANEAIQHARPEAKPNALRLRALFLLLRYSGLRIGDAVGCPVNLLVDGKLRLYTQKTGTHVHCPLPEFVSRELDVVPRAGEHHWFWTGKCVLKTAVTDWQAKIKKLFAKAGVADGHAHRFRDTFAVSLLMEGVPLERVSVMLGHSSIKITEKHYRPWVRERQAQAEADVRRAWENDPVVLIETRGTPQVHGMHERVM